jgi:LysM repeat protein
MNINDTSPVTAKGKQGKVCPYLGLLQDSQTTLGYPSSSNVCYHAKPIASPNLDHQRSFCLRGRQHTICPVFTRRIDAPLPPDIRLPANNPLFGKPVEKRVILPILLGCVVLILGVMGVFWVFKDHRINGGTLSGEPRSPTPSSIAISLATGTFPYTDIPVTPNTYISVTPRIETEVPQTPTKFSVSPVPFQTPVPCGSPYTWIVYIVQPGDSLYRLSLVYRVTIAELQRANCLGNSTLLHTGQILHVPPWATLMPLPTAIATETPTDALTDTPEPSLPSDTPTEPATSMPTDTPIPTEAPTETPVPSTP